MCLQPTTSLVTVALILWGWATEAVALFEISQLHANGDIKHEIKAAFLTDPDHANLLASIVVDDLHRYIAVYAAKDDHHYVAEPVNTLEISDDVIFLDTGKVGSADTESLILFKRNQALVVNPLTGEQTELVRFSSLYTLPVIGELPGLDLVRDINGDGLEDMMVPDFDGYWLFMQVEAGVFSQGKLLAMPATMGVPYGTYVSYRPANPYFADINLDRLQDIVFWSQDEFKVFFQDDNLNYRAEAESYQPGMDFQEEGLAGISIGLGGAEDQSNVEAKTLYKFTDLNRDGFVDIVTLSVRSSGVLKKTSRYEVHMGFEVDGTVGHSSVPESVIESDGIQFEIDEQDFNNDGSVDFVVSSVEIGLGKILAALITGSISTDLSFYRMNGDRYPTRPNATREIKATFSLSSGEVFYPTVMIADVNGDLISDLIVQDGRKGMKIFAGEESDDLFARQPAEFPVDMPNNPELIHMTDLNRDGKKDIIIRYEDGDDRLLNSINVLIAR